MTADTVRPIGDQVIIRTAPRERVSRGGVLFTEMHENAPTEGEVIALGDGVREILGEEAAWRYARAALRQMFGTNDVDRDIVRETADALMAESAVRHPFTVAVGQKVLFVPWLASTVILEGVEHHVVADRDIVGVVESHG